MIISGIAAPVCSSCPLSLVALVYLLNRVHLFHFRAGGARFSSTTTLRVYSSESGFHPPLAKRSKTLVVLLLAVRIQLVVLVVPFSSLLVLLLFRTLFMSRAIAPAWPLSCFRDDDSSDRRRFCHGVRTHLDFPDNGVEVGQYSDQFFKTPLPGGTQGPSAFGTAICHS